MRRTCSAGAASVLLLLTGVGSASAASADHQSVLDRVGTRIAVESAVEAGYTARLVGRGSPIRVVATVTVPTLACGSEDAGVVTSVGVVEMPYRFAGGQIHARCAGGEATYGARLETSSGTGEEIDGVVEAGDRIKITAEWNGSVGRPEVEVEMTSVDRGWQESTQFEFIADGFNGAVFRQIPMWVDGTKLGLADYADARVQQARVDREALGDVRRTRFVLVDADGDRLVVPSRIRAGRAFDFSYVG